ncbi:hypothetical protein VIMY103929_20940 [Vibrio mytili]|uniref:Uncharacterized protein n=1 Tax=Vibrio mytili TaxID=50718 RepID=A0A0C3I4V5_9VIBR|nr:hypothetical protein SU60_20275 [Vibrio mytili]
MNILLMIATVFLAKFIGSQMGFTYSLFSAPFSLKLALIDFSLYVVAGVVINFVYNKAKHAFKTFRQN